MKLRSLVSLTVAIIAVFVLCAGGLGGMFGGGSAAGACLPVGISPATTASASAAPPTRAWPTIGQWDGDQVANAAAIVTTGARTGIPARGWVIAVATAMQESTLRNLPGGDRDSVGLFQQRPSQGWGNPAQLQDPIYASEKFYAKLITVTGWESMPLTEAAQAVQVSAYPDAYAKWEVPATQLVTAVVSSGNLAVSLDLEQCPSSCPEILSSPARRGSDVVPSGDVVRCEWVVPVHAPIVSGFRTAERPGHDGVDLGAARGTPIHVASAGTVVVVRCNVVPANHGCDQDGSPSTPGRGWYVDVLHEGDVVTRYCHMLTHPMVVEGQQVLAGQAIGAVGSSGHSSGPHLHFEVHVNGDRSPSGAVDPVGFMQNKGVPLGR